MIENPSRRLNKVYIVLLYEYPEDGEGGYDSVQVVFVSQYKAKIDEIEKLWDIVQKEHHRGNKKMEKALNNLKNKFGIICWSGQDLRIEERELQ